MKVYIVVENWEFPSVGDSGVSLIAYFNKEKAIEKIEERQKEILSENDYMNTLKNEDGVISYHNCICDYTYDYYDIWLEEHEIL